MKIAVIPARGGSKRIPRKNIKEFCGKPMIAWSIEAALKSGCFDRVIVSIDDQEIADVAKQYGAQVPFMRPAELSDDYAGTFPLSNRPALGISQMQRLDEFVAQRHRLAERYNQLLADLPLTLPWQHPDSYSGLHLYVIRLQLDKINKSHRQVFEALRERGIGVNLHYIPVHTQPYYQAMGLAAEDFPEAMAYYREAISLPMFQGLTDEQQDRVVTALSETLFSGAE